MIAGIGAGAFLGFATSLIGNHDQNKSAINQINRLGDNLAITTRAINFSRDQLDRDLGDILSENALSTAKNMATAKVLMSTSGTIGGTSRQVARQAYVDQIRADADVIGQARKQDISLLNQALSERIAFRNQANATRSQIKSPLEAIVGTVSAMVQGGTSGATIGQNIAPVGGFKLPSMEDSIFSTFGTTTQLPSIDYSKMRG